MKHTRVYRFSLFAVYLLLILFALISCKLGPDYIRTTGAVPETFTQDFPSDSSIANIPWWELFGDTVLNGLIAKTLENNHDLAAAVARMDEGMAVIGMTRAELYPRINYSLSGNSSLNTASNGVVHDYTGVLDISYTIDIWGHVKRLNEAALQEYLATEEACRGMTMMLVASVANAYLTLRDLDNRLIIAEQTAKTWQENLDIVSARQKGGFVSEVDLNQAKIQLLEALTAIETFTRLRIQTENAVCQIMGEYPHAIPRGLKLQDQIFPPELPVGIPSDILDRRPDVMQAERQLHAQTARIGAAEALKYPSFTISADLGFAFADPAYGFAALGEQILGPLFNNKAARYNVEAEKARTVQLLNNYEQMILTAFREAEDAMVAVNSYKKEFSLRNEQMLAAREAARLAWVRYEGGLTSYLEVLDLQRSYFSAQLNASETLQLQLTSMVKLYQALGGGWLSK